MVTLKQIAEKVGVSAATVSRVLNADASLSISPVKRQAVIETAEALNYATPRSRNRAGTAVSKIALVHFLRPEQELADPYYVGMRLGIERQCQASRIEVVKAYHTDSAPDAALLRAAAGVIVVGQHTQAEIAWLEQHCSNLVFADFTPPGEGEHDSVENDLPLAMRRLLNDLDGLGYRRFGFIGWEHLVDGAQADFGEKRCRAFIDWTRDRGVFEPDWCLVGEKSEGGGHGLATRVLGGADRPEVLVTANDNMAIGAYRAIAELGLRLPGDVAVASFNDISVAQFLNPPLSTVRLPSEEIGENAVALLLERIAGRDVPKRVVLGSRTIWRGSTRNPVAREITLKSA